MTDQIDIWKPFASNYIDKVFTVAQFPGKRQMVIEHLRPGTVLDVGSGPTTFLINALDKDHRFRPIAADLCKSMLTSARQQICQQPNRTHFVQCHNTRLPFAASSVANVVSINSILPEDRSEIAPVVSEISRVLKPGGRFIAVLPAFEMSLIAKEHWEIPIKVDERTHREWDTTGWQSFYTKQDVESLVEGSGMQLNLLERLQFSSGPEIEHTRAIYGRELQKSTLQEHPLFEHFLVAER